MFVRYVRIVGSLKVVVDRASPVPLYFQMAEQIEHAIRSGQLAPGDRLDTEQSLADRYALSRPTVRQAMQELVNKGLLVRRRGIGTQVVQTQLRRTVELTSLYDDLSAANHEPSTTVLSLKTVPATGPVAEGLRLRDGDDVLEVRRLRFDGGAPLALMTNWLPKDLLTTTREELESTGLYDIMRQSGVQPRVANQSIGARAATAAEAKHLGVKTGAPLVTMERTAFDSSGRAVEYARHGYRGDSYSFETTLISR